MGEGREHWWSRARRDGDGAGDPSAPAPLHEPDPYGTPPYGRPGPWAPAPPVQPPTGASPALESIPDAAPQLPLLHPPMPGTGGASPVAAPGPADGSTMPAPAHLGAQPYPSADGPRPAGPGFPQPYAAAAGHQGPQAPQPGAPMPPGAPGAAGAQPMPGGHVAAGAQPMPGGHAATGAQPYPTPARPPVLGVTSPYAAPAAPQGPWQYDPWAVERRPEPAAPAAGKAVARRKVVVGALVVALVAGGVGGGIGAWLERDGGGRRVTLPQAPVDKGDRDPGSVAGIAARALPGVVTLHVRGSSARGTGTGFVLDGRGHILTNNHVVEPAGERGEIVVTFNGGQTAKATVVGRDSGYDLAVVKVSGVSGLTPLALGNSDSVHVGDSVVAIGAPLRPRGHGHHGDHQRQGAPRSPRAAGSRTAATSATSTRSRRTPRSIRAIRADRWWTPGPGSSGSTAPSARPAARRRAAARAGA
ncbi:hypothetical protein GCM10020221_20770 [Streptomyces thioluteus]|uniref:Protease n=1 Tax=Streptomyces thioluteus TaxID=66431 RepID=A0ABN3WT47_STRTU